MPHASRILPVAWAFAAVLVLLALGAGAAQAQTPVKLVSNAGTAGGSTASRSLHHAQAFTTGDHSYGYTITAVDIDVTGTFDAATTVSIHSNVSNRPGASQGTLAFDRVEAHLVRFTSGGIRLAPNTTYFVVATFGGTGSFTNKSDNGEDPGAASGWSIGDSGLWKQPQLNAWNVTGNSMKIAVHGKLEAPPQLRSASVSGTTLSILFTKALDAASVPAASAFSVRGIGGHNVRLTPTGVRVGGKYVILTLDREPGPTDMLILVHYTKPASNPLQDEAGNAAGSFFAPVGRDDSRPEPPPVPDGPTLSSAERTGGNQIRLTFSENLKLTGGGVPSPGAFRVWVEDAKRTPSQVTARPPRSLDLTLSGSAMTDDSTVWVLYEPGRAGGDAHMIRNLDGDAAPGFNRQVRTDVTPPAVSGATVAGSALTLTWDQALDEDSVPAASAFTVTGIGASQRATGVSVLGRTVTLTLARGAGTGHTVRVSYAKPASNPLRDAAGNEVADFSNRAVTNGTERLPPRIRADAQNVYIEFDRNIRTGSRGSHPMSGDRCPASQAFTLKVNGVAYGSWATRDVTGGPAGGNGLAGGRAKCDARRIHLELWDGPGFYLIPPGSTVTLSYDPNWVETCPGCGRVTYADGSVMPAFRDMPVENNTRYVWWTSVNGTDLLAYFFYNLNTGSVPAPDAFTVTVNGARRNVVANGVSFFGNSNAGVKLVLESPVALGDRVRLAYTRPSVNPLRGTRGNPAVPSFDAITVRNDSTGSGTTPTVTGLVSNTGKTESASQAGLVLDYAQGFTTGSNAAGYKLTRVRTGLDTVAHDHSSAGVSLSIWSDSSGLPGSKLGTLTKPDTLSGGGALNDFDAPGDGIDLEANTKYYMVFDSSQSSAFSWADTGSTDEDSGAAAGWSIADNFLHREYNSTGSWTVSTAFVLRIGIHGYAKSGGAGGASDNSGPSFQSSSVSGNKLKMTFDGTLAQGLAPPGGSFKVTVGPGPQGGARGNGGVRGMGGAGANGGGFGGALGVGAQTTSGGRTVDIPGTGTVTVDGTEVTVTLARPVPPGSTVTVGYTPPDEDENALRGLEGAKVEEFSGEPVAHGAPAANRAPVVDEQSSNYATFTASGTAPRGVLVTKPFEGIFSDPDGDELTYTVALTDSGQAALVETLHVLTEEELAASPRPEAVAHLVWFRADAEADWGAMEPAVPDPVAIRATLTATDPDGLSASVEGVFLTHWAPPKVESVAVVSNAGPDDTYALGETIRVAVKFDDPVAVDTSGGTPRLAIDMDPADWGAKWASYASGSGTRELVFAYEVTEPNYSTQGIAVLADSLELNGGGIHLASAHLRSVTDGTAAALGHAGLGHDPKHKVNWGLAPAPEPAPPAAAPEATGVAVVSDAGPDDTYGIGDVIRVAVTFDAAVTVTGTPGLKIDMDPAAWGEKRAAYESGSGTARLVFAHTVVEPNYSTQGIAVVADSLALDGGTIRTASGADAALAHAGLGHDARHKVDWRPELSVADAEANEGADATVDFAVTLSRAYTNAAHSVTVDYATSDGTATAGEDYTATSGTLTFAAGETEKTVSVPILDDAIDEGSETFTLRLSNAQGARIADGEATGTIKNSDSMPKAWTARFGRSVAVHVLDAVAGRLDEASDSWVQLGGHRLGGGPDLRESVQHLAPERSLWAEADASDPAGQALTFRDLLMGSAFHLVSNPEDETAGPRLSAWGRVATSGFDGREDKLSLDGMVTTATLGVDGTWKRWLTGLLLAHSEGDGSFTHLDAPGGDVSSSLTSVHPYVAYRLNDRVRLWGLVGYGGGDLQLRLDEQQAMDTDLTMTMGALGVRGSLLDPSRPSGFELALRSDVLWMVMDSDAAANLAATEAEASRLRLVLEGSKPIALAGGGSFTPSLEVGLRHDGGDAETGTGVEVAGRVRYASSWGLSIEASGRGLLAHEAKDYTEWGASGALRFDPGKQGRGFTASLTPAWGSAASGMSRLWSQPDAAGLVTHNVLAAATGRLDAELGYGLAALNGRGLLTPYARVALTEGADQAWHLGTRLALRESLDLSLEASRRARQGETAAHEVALRANLGF